jgi:hypothetical protein
MMAERQDLELKCGTAPKGGEKCGQNGGKEVPERESKEKGQTQFISQIGFCENHKSRRKVW